MPSPLRSGSVALFKAMEHGIVERPTKRADHGYDREAVAEYLAELEARVRNGSKRPVQTYSACKQILQEFQAYRERVAKRVCQRSPSLTSSTTQAGPIAREINNRCRMSSAKRNSIPPFSNCVLYLSNFCRKIDRTTFSER